MNIFISMIFGHLVGDYLLQNNWMALSKGQSSFRCFVHCVIYTLSVCFFMNTYSLYWILLVFFSHFPIDRWSLADKWLVFINGRNLKDFLYNGNKDIRTPKGEKFWYQHESNDVYSMNYRILRGGFTTFVYAAVDNTMHLLIMWYGYKLFTVLNLF